MPEVKPNHFGWTFQKFPGLLRFGCFIFPFLCTTLGEQQEALWGVLPWAQVLEPSSAGSPRNPRWSCRDLALQEIMLGFRESVCSPNLGLHAHVIAEGMGGNLPSTPGGRRWAFERSSPISIVDEQQGSGATRTPSTGLWFLCVNDGPFVKKGIYIWFF